MIEDHFQSFFIQVIFESTGIETEDINFRFVSGGCINNAVKLKCAAGNFFLKWNENAPSDMFETEAKGLKLLANNGIVATPIVINQGKADGKYYLLLELLEPAPRDKTYWETLGFRLAELHGCKDPRHGLSYDNYIGRLHQNNAQSSSWIDFFINNRLRPQVELAKNNHLLPTQTGKQFELFFEKLPNLIPEASPSLLHGDLWSGNIHTGPDGQAWLIDPAVYYGNREMDLAFTKLFGGFDPLFYQAYREANPMQPGWQERIDICNVYPLMVHVNLFGLSYLSAVERTISRYL